MPSLDLTPREEDFVRLLAAGLKVPEIATYLGLRPNTIWNQMAIARKRNDCATFARLTARYVAEVSGGVIPLRPPAERREDLPGR